jgi:hypothetical protein
MSLTLLRLAAWVPHHRPSSTTMPAATHCPRLEGTPGSCLACVVTLNLMQPGSHHKMPSGRFTLGKLELHVTVEGRCFLKLYCACTPPVTARVPPWHSHCTEPPCHTTRGITSINPPAAAALAHMSRLGDGAWYILYRIHLAGAARLVLVWLLCFSGQYCQTTPISRPPGLSAVLPTCLHNAPATSEVTSTLDMMRLVVACCSMKGV